MAGLGDPELPTRETWSGNQVGSQGKAGISPLTSRSIWGMGVIELIVVLGSYLLLTQNKQTNRLELKCICVFCFMSQDGQTLGSPDPRISHLRTLPFLRPGTFKGNVEAFQPRGLAVRQNSWRD